jgi:hypothetical protein
MEGYWHWCRKERRLGMDLETQVTGKAQRLAYVRRWVGTEVIRQVLYTQTSTQP